MMLTGENRNTASATLFIILIIFCNSILLCYVSQLRKWCEMLCGGWGGMCGRNRWFLFRILKVTEFNPLNPELNPICYLLAL